MLTCPRCYAMCEYDATVCHECGCKLVAPPTRIDYGDDDEPVLYMELLDTGFGPLVKRMMNDEPEAA